MNLLKFSNKFFFQWFFIRLVKKEETIVEMDQLLGYDITNGFISSRGMGKYVPHTTYHIMYWIRPLSGWNKDYIYLNKKLKSIKIK